MNADLIERIHELELDEFVAAHQGRHFLVPPHAFAQRDSLRITARPIGSADRTVETPAITQPPAAFVIYEVPATERVTVGRDPGNDIVIDDLMVSRRHAAILRRGSTFVVVDLESSHGTRIGRSRLRPHAEAPLCVGDTLHVASLEMVFADAATLFRLGRGLPR